MLALCPVTRWKSAWVQRCLSHTALILTAGHVANNEVTPGNYSSGVLEVASGSFTLDYNDSSPAQTKFYKVKLLVKTGTRKPFATTTVVDYAVLEIAPPPPVNISRLVPREVVADPLGVANPPQFFIIHHPDGKPKQVSRPRAGLQPCVRVISGVTFRWFFDCDCDKGTSGSPIFMFTTNDADPANGTLVGIATEIFPNNPAGSTAPGGRGELNAGPPSSKVQEDFIRPAQDPVEIFRMVVLFDRSGSMDLIGTTGQRKIAEAKSAVSLFYSLLRYANTAPPPGPPIPHDVGLVSFSTNPTSELANPPGIVQFTPVTRPTLNARIAALEPTDLTAIGDALVLGQSIISGTAIGTRSPYLLLLTDGIETAGITSMDNANVGTTRVDVIGFGRDSELNGEGLSRLATRHHGVYTRSNDGLQLKKFFAAIYGSVFEQTNLDPIDQIPAGNAAVAPIPFNVTNETMLQVVLGWEHPDAFLELSLQSPSGTILDGNSPGVVADRSGTWTHLRLELPYNGEPAGTWFALVTRREEGQLRYRGHLSCVKAVAFSPDSKSFISGAADRSLLLQDVQVPHPIRTFFYTADHPSDRDGITGVAFLSEGANALTLGTQDGLILWDVARGRPIRTYEDGDVDSLGNHLAYSPARNLAAVAQKNRVAIWDVDSGELLHVLFWEAKDEVTALAFTPDGTSLVIGLSPYSQDTALILADVSSGQMQQSYPANDVPLCIVVSQNGQYLAAGFSSAEVILYDLSAGIVVDAFTVSSPPMSLAFSPDSNFLLIGGSAWGSGPAQLSLRDLSANSTLILEGHDPDQNIPAVAFSPDGKLAVSGSCDETLLLWHIPDGTPVFAPLDVTERIFVSSIVTSEVFMAPLLYEGPVSYYTGDALYPQVILRANNGIRVRSHVFLDIEAPERAIGEVIMEHEPYREENLVMHGDPLDQRQSALILFQNSQTEPLIPMLPIQTFELFDDASHYDGGIEPDGIFGNEISGITLYEGNYTLRAYSDWGSPILIHRETSWTIYVGIGIDSSKTTVETSPAIPVPGQIIAFRFFPRDVYGSALGPGRSNSFMVEAIQGTELQGGLYDWGDGSYEQKLVWFGDGDVALIVRQPDRNPIILSANNLHDEKSGR